MCIDWPSGIQAGAAVAIVILTAWTLKVLRNYAADTKRIAETGIKQVEYSQLQIEHSQMPFLALVFTGIDGWLIRNEGFGPAINIQHSTPQGDQRGTRMATPLGPGDIENMHNLVAAFFARWQQFEIEYESLSGKRYRTIVTMENDQTRTQFQRDAR